VDRSAFFKTWAIRLYVECLVDSKHLLVPRWQAKNAKNSTLVDGADLNMRFVVESRTFVEFGAFHEQGPHCLIRQDRRFRLCHLLPGAMEMLNHRTVEIPLTFFGSEVLREGFPYHRVYLHESFVGRPYSLDAFLRGEIQASSQIDDRAYYRRVFDCSPRQACPLKRPDRVTLPEVDTGAKPVVGLFADQKLRTAQKYLGGLDAASVVGKDKIIQAGGTPALIFRLGRSSHPS